jgi:predicted enzyme related to lactoylglutathione lyase
MQSVKLSADCFLHTSNAKEIIMSNKENSINYIELPMLNNAETKQFYTQVFGWEFTDWGPDYISFSGANIDGGFNGVGDAQVSSSGVLVVLYAKDLDQKLEDVTKAGGEIVKPIFEFPGGKRFHFLDPNGNQLAVWSE